MSLDHFCAVFITFFLTFPFSGLMQYECRKCFGSIFLTFHFREGQPNIRHMPPERFFLIASFKYWQTSHNCFCSVADNDVAISTAWIHLQYSRSLYILHGSEKLFKLSLLFCNMKTTKLSESVNCKTNKQKSLSCSDLRFISLLVNSFIFSCV